jgi:hypothetical protein
LPSVLEQHANFGSKISGPHRRQWPAECVRNSVFTTDVPTREVHSFLEHQVQTVGLRVPEMSSGLFIRFIAMHCCTYILLLHTEYIYIYIFDLCGRHDAFLQCMSILYYCTIIITDIYIYICIYREREREKQIVAGFPLWRCGFNPGFVHVGFVVDKVTLIPRNATLRPSVIRGWYPSTTHVPSDSVSLHSKNTNMYMYTFLLNIRVCSPKLTT